MFLRSAQVWYALVSSSSHGLELEPLLLPSYRGAEIWAEGVANAALVHDRQVVQSVELSPVVAAYVDNVAVIGENRPRVMDTMATIKNRLESDSLRCKEMEEPGDHERFLGLIFDRKRGCTAENGRGNLLDAAAREFLCGDGLLQLIAHFTGATLGEGEDSMADIMGIVSLLGTSNLGWSGTLLAVAKSGNTLWNGHWST